MGGRPLHAVKKLSIGVVNLRHRTPRGLSDPYAMQVRYSSRRQGAGECLAPEPKSHSESLKTGLAVSRVTARAQGRRKEHGEKSQCIDRETQIPAGSVQVQGQS